MQASVNTIVRNLFQRDHLEEVGESQLEEYVKQYPYSSIGHLLLTKKKKDAGVDYSKEAAVASLYINNPLWLHYFLDEQPHTAAESSTESVTALATHELLEEPDVPKKEIEIEETEIVAAEEPTNVEERKEEINEEAKQEEHIEVEVEAPVEEKVEPVVPEVPAATVNETPDLVGSEFGNHKPDYSVQVEQELVFEPYHTIDYFASQGIKLKAEDLTKDKFGRQLKSFTDWLRSMKRIAPIQADEATAAPINDASIVKSAEESIETSEVETEAMAEVWLKQGKTARAIAIYHKLSLLNPSKSHYFAAKIEQLNA